MQLENLTKKQIVPKLCPSRSNFSKWFQTKPKVKLKNVYNQHVKNIENFDFFYLGLRIRKSQVRILPGAP